MREQHNTCISEQRALGGVSIPYKKLWDLETESFYEWDIRQTQHVYLIIATKHIEELKLVCSYAENRYGILLQVQQNMQK